MLNKASAWGAQEVVKGADFVRLNMKVRTDLHRLNADVSFTPTCLILWLIVEISTCLMYFANV